VPSAARVLVIFAKAPRVGAVKTRLARDIGAVAAATLARDLTARTLRLVADPRWTTCLAVTPDDACALPLWPRAVPRMGQGAGDLGQRMRRALIAAAPRPTLLVGSDIPALTPDHIAAAFRALGSADLVFGPAEDGGFWLVGFSHRRPLPRRLFHNVRWSSEQPLADSLAGLDQLHRVALLDRLADLDTVEDLRRWRQVRDGNRQGEAG
jgi:rSAM/selenodomain-associated transferase 1